jgi:hypothetical protein
MNVFGVIAARTDSMAQLQAAIESNFPGNFIKVADNFWFVAGTATAFETSQKLGVAGKAGGTLGHVIVLSVTNYWGNAEATVWEWISNRMEAKVNG